jgi:hypothetical protein
MVEILCYCVNVDGLFQALVFTHNPVEWRLFIDSSSSSLKGVLLHNGNKHPSIPIEYSIHMKEKHDNVKDLLESVKFKRYLWELCGDLKIIGFLLGMQGGFTKYSCFLCLWDSRASREHYV